MKATETKLAGVYLLEPTVFGDSRGYFFESFNNRKFEELTGYHKQPGELTTENVFYFLFAERVH